MDSKRITHVLFDVDGLLLGEISFLTGRFAQAMILLDTEALYTEVTQEIVAPYGKTFDWDVKVKMMGRPPIQSSQILVDELELPITAEEYLQIAAERFAAAFPRANLMPGETTPSSKAAHLDLRVRYRSRKGRTLFRNERHSHGSSHRIVCNQLRTENIEA